MMISSKTVILLLFSHLSASSAKLGGGTKERKLVESDEQVWTNRPTKQLYFIGSSLDPTQSLNQCQGDCDSNDDCGEGLVCFQRNAYEEVPGCNGGRSDSSNSDYCVRPSDLEVLGPPDLMFVTDHPNEGSLGRCQGDCDTDEDCEGNQICYQKGDCEYVPGCNGWENDYSYTDYCVRKSDLSAGELALDIPDDFYLLQLCQGDCDEDWDCGVGLICHQRNENEPVPGCLGGMEDNSRTDYCVSDYRGNSRKDVIESSLGVMEYTLSFFSEDEEGSPGGLNKEALEWLVHADLWVPPVEEENPQELWRERYAMASLYFATKGGKWFDAREYLSIWSVCTWSGIGDEVEVHCDENDRVVKITGRENGMLGSIPAELGYLTMLERIDFSTNNIRGSIPSALGLLTHMTRLDLSQNNLTGSIPKEVSRLTNLERIALFDNGLTGTLPEDISKLSNLQRFLIGDNVISGSIPDIGTWTKVTYMEMSNNRITGSLPDIGNLSSLNIFQVSKNRFSGTIPSSIPRSLQHFDLRSNSIGGSLPSFDSDIQTIDLAYNTLTGSLDNLQIGRLTWLYDLDLRGNELTGSLPSELERLTFLTDFDVGENRLTGDVPPLGNQLTNCSLDNNSFSDTTNAEGICRLS